MPPEAKPETPPLISIIVPAYRAEKFLPMTVGSVLAQTFEDWELILIDDGSPDDTYAAAQRLAKISPRIRAFTQPNGGPAAARNGGYSHSNPASLYVAFLDGDDCWEPDALANLKGALDARPDACGAYALGRLMDVEGNPLPDDEKITRCRERKRVVGETLTLAPADSLTDFESLVIDNYILTPGVALLRRAAIEAVGLFDTALFGTEDWEMWVRLTRVNPFVFLDLVALNYRQHPQSVSKKGRSMSKNTLMAREKVLRSDQNTPAQREAARKGMRLHYAQVFGSQARSAAHFLRRGQPLRAARTLRYAFLLRRQVAAMLG